MPPLDRQERASRRACARSAATMPPRSTPRRAPRSRTRSPTRSSPLFATATIVAAYAPMKDEISPLPAMAARRAAHLRLAFPFFVDRDSRMTFRAGTPGRSGPVGHPPARARRPDRLARPHPHAAGRGRRRGQSHRHGQGPLRPRAARPARRRRAADRLRLGFQRIDEPLAPDPWDVPLDGFASPDGLEMFR